jgi:glutaredoxin-related protein
MYILPTAPILHDQGERSNATTSKRHERKIIHLRLLKNNLPFWESYEALYITRRRVGGLEVVGELVKHGNFDRI